MNLDNYFILNEVWDRQTLLSLEGSEEDPLGLPISEEDVSFFIRVQQLVRAYYPGQLNCVLFSWSHGHAYCRFEPEEDDSVVYKKASGGYDTPYRQKLYMSISIPAEESLYRRQQKQLAFESMMLDNGMYVSNISQFRFDPTRLFTGMSDSGNNVWPIPVPNFIAIDVLSHVIEK